jgi:hypothetical protein
LRRRIERHAPEEGHEGERRERADGSNDPPDGVRVDGPERARDERDTHGHERDDERGPEDRTPKHHASNGAKAMQQTRNMHVRTA